MKRTLLVCVSIMCILITGCHPKGGKKQAEGVQSDSAEMVEPVDTTTKTPEVTVDPIPEEPVLEMVTATIL